MSALQLVNPMQVDSLSKDNGALPIPECFGDSILPLSADGKRESAAYRLAGTIYATLGYLRLGEEYLNKSGADPMSPMLLAIVLSQQGRNQDMLEALRRQPNSGAILESNGEAAYQAERHEEAFALLKMALQVDPTSIRRPAEVYHHLALMAAAKNELEAAVTYSRRWHEIASGELEASILLATNLIRTNRPDEAQIVLRDAEALKVTEHPLYPLIMGRIHELHGDWKEAIFFYRQAVALNPNDIYSDWYLARALYQTDRNQEAIPYLEAVLRSASPALQQAAQQMLNQIRNTQQPQP